MGSDDVFNRRWILAEDELLRLLWRCRGGENPDVALLELHARRRPAPASGSTRRVTRHCQRGEVSRGRTKRR